ncbi:MAG: hypothetical protein ACREKN_09840 [Longimicrobiaceae bacterium]
MPAKLISPLRLLAGAALLLALPGCGGGGEARVRPPPSGDAPSDELRLGLPEVGGRWQVPPPPSAPPLTDTAAGEQADSRPATEELLVRQRLDSLAALYRRGGMSIPLVGEVRRGGRISLVAVGGEWSGAFAFGRTRGDTLALVMGTLLDQARWRSPEPVVLLRGEALSRRVRPPPRLPADTTASRDTLVSDTLPPGPPAQDPEPFLADTAAPEPEQPREEEPQPEPEPPEPEPEGPPLLGEPVEPGR